ncbi:MAG: adenosylhomocysteinase [Candidatus Caldatribacteriota bacterium]|nr:adenosylhomocysteinase [Candidatus Caldatribacteriota bacterium]
MDYEIKDIKLAEKGKERIEWAEKQMVVLLSIRNEFASKKPLRGVKIAACLHVTTETANLVRTLKTGGAEVFLCASNPLSTQDSVAASLVKDYGISVHAVKGEDKNTYYQHIRNVLDCKPNLTMDDGADLVSTIHSKRNELIDEIIGGSEETTTGVIRLKSMENDQALKYPIIAVNDAQTKYLFDNRYGTGQSTLDGLLRATNILVAGKKFVVCGYGWCARGLAMRAGGMGAQVIVTEVDPMKALEAVMDGYQVMPIREAAKIGDIFITLTGNINVVSFEDFPLMKDGAIIANSGHFNVEVNIKALEDLAVSKKRIRDYIVEYTLDNGKKLNLLAEGRLLNLSAAEGHPASVMDMSFANQALSAEYLIKEGKHLEGKVYSVPENIDKEIARLKLKSMGIKIDKLTREQEIYLSSWEMGT